MDLEKIFAGKTFWDSPEAARPVFKERSQLTAILDRFGRLDQDVEDAGILLELAREEEDATTLKELDRTLLGLEKRVDRLEVEQLLDEENDESPALVSINAGAGGTEAQDWVSMLFRMVLKWAEKKGYQTTMLDWLDGEEAGIKNVTVSVKGPYAYGYLKSESGIHRLVRISPFDAGGRRHTSFASVYVYPDVEEEIVVDINEGDLRIDTFRASGHGGQHVNKTSSAVRITHLPSGIVVQCQNEKSQHKNKEMAMKVLRARLYEQEKGKRLEKQQEIYEQQADIAWGSQIRSYVLHPYRLIKDHRTQAEMGNVDAVLDGELDPFMGAFLKWRQVAKHRVLKR